MIAKDVEEEPVANVTETGTQSGTLEELARTVSSEIAEMSPNTLLGASSIPLNPSLATRPSASSAFFCSGNRSMTVRSIVVRGGLNTGWISSTDKVRDRWMTKPG